MVRLKLNIIALIIKNWQGLNSTMVRLKLVMKSIRDLQSNLSQFHYGSIKTIN